MGETNRRRAVNVQTFLPYRDFRRSAECLDNRRLGKQRVEAMQILMTLLDANRGWRRHPAVAMWRGYEYMLALYGIEICNEWRRRGFRDTCKEKIIALTEQLAGGADEVRVDVPTWLGREDFHRSHQSNLVRKDEEHYRRYFPDVANDLPYVWPAREEN